MKGAGPFDYLADPALMDLETHQAVLQWVLRVWRKMSAPRPTRNRPPPRARKAEFWGRLKLELTSSVALLAATFYIASRRHHPCEFVEAQENLTSRSTSIENCHAPIAHLYRMDAPTIALTASVVLGLLGIFGLFGGTPVRKELRKREDLDVFNRANRHDLDSTDRHRHSLSGNEGLRGDITLTTKDWRV